MKKYWDNLINKYSDDAELNNSMFAQLNENYSQPVRHYHTFTHIHDFLQTLEIYKIEIKDFDALCFAVWFHDAIYFPLRTNNEELSAEFAKKFLKKINYPPELYRKIHHYILRTNNHSKRDKSESFDFQIFIDADLKILSSDRDSYITYKDQIRQEFKMVPEFIYNKKRVTFLKDFLKHKSIYRTDYFKKYFEPIARENIKFEISELSK